ncbi:hypothetical protein SCHPADRAFT_860844 [Schizopora paradoxa]|uniref:STB6-like N-terminal domain-containing protein n=1 Tax=Schizopora paradoxa TaxID=27342 RepID=A0A0H2R511_9AGAM|nr:hypothetical protein SCHPADRAFT_860844 [Schizopora paradoxa]
MSYDFLKTPPRRSRDETSPSRPSVRSYAGLFTRSLSSPQTQPVSPGTSPQLSPVPSRHGGSAPRTSIGSSLSPYSTTKSNNASTISALSSTPTRSQATVTNTSATAVPGVGSTSQLPELGSPFQPLKSQIPSVPRRLLVPTRGRLPTDVLPGTSGFNSSTGILPISPPNAGGPDGVASGRTSRHSRWGSASFNPEATPGSAGSPPVRSSRSSITSRLGRPRSDSAPLDAPPAAAQGAGAISMAWSSSGTAKESEEKRWLCHGKKFEVVEEDVQLVGYQIYAVEKWIVERNRKVALLSVYTGDMKDKINVTALAPISSLPRSEQDDEWQSTMHDLRREGARPRETDKGVIMVTSLANFRSDYTVVHIPDGDFLKHREQLYVNINLLRMGCSGRSVLTLQEPSDTTKERFMSMYHFRDDVKPLYRFLPTVLELVRLIQIGLALFDMFPMDAEQQNGLLCDATVEGIKTWISEIGEPYLKIEPNERVADPTTVSALITTILSMRNKLTSLGISHVPKDPFLHPRQFSRALATYVNQRLLNTSPVASSPSPPSLVGSNGNSNAFTAPAGVTHVHRAYLNVVLMQRVDAAFEKHRATEAYKVHRVLFAKLDDITTATSQALATATARTAGRQTSAGGTSQPTSMSPGQVQGTSVGGGKDREGSGEKDLVDGTTDLAGFVARALGARGKDSFAAPYVRYLWSGRLDQLEIKRLEGLWADTEKEREEVLRERERDREQIDSDDELGVMAGPGAGWSNKVQRKIESWAERGREKVGRGKKGSVDLSSAIKDKLSHLGSTGKAQLPSVVVSRDPGEQLSGLSSGQVSPISPTGSTIALGAFSSGHNSTLAIDDTEYRRRLDHFNQMHPSRRPSLVAAARSMTLPTRPEATVTEGTPEAPPGYGLGLGGSQRDVSVWSPPMSIRSGTKHRGGSSMSRQISREAEEDLEQPFERTPPNVWKLKRSYSSGDIYYMSLRDSVPFQQMQIDVDLCGQLMVFRRRLARVQAVQAILESFVESSAAANDELRQYHAAQADALQALAERCQIVSDIEEAVRTVDGAGLDTDALLYEEHSFNVPALWRMAQGPRQRVFAIRERVFGTRRGRGRNAQRLDEEKAQMGRGRFNRVQRTLDGKERYVDWLGRTESDVEEERELPEIMPGDEGGDDDSEYEVEMHVSGVPSVQSLKERAEADAKGEEAEGYVSSTSAWFLELFSRWGRVMGVRGGATTTQATQASVQDSPKPVVKVEVRDDGDSDVVSEDIEMERKLREIPEEGEDAEVDEDFQTAPPSKEHSRSPAR